MRPALPDWRAWALALLVAAAGLAALWAMGRTPICTCGTVKFWHGAVVSSENSQHLTDWYSPSHLLHGLVFYAALAALLPRSGLGVRLVLATAAETAWEVIENTDRVIERYREATIALDYYGDSIVNSAADIAMMWLGFLIAARGPAWLSVALFLGAEAFVTYAIRDGLLLNILMLLWPLQSVAEWQSGR